MDKAVNFEQNIKELEEVVRQLERGDIALGDLLVLFEKGVGLTKSCNSQLDNAEQKINMLLQNKATGEMEEAPMTAMEVEVAPEKPKGKHFVATTNDVPPLPAEVEAPPENDVQQAFIDIDSL